jgi:hypothetical protein
LTQEDTMERIAIDRKLFNYRGQFYPTGHIMAMLPSEEEARAAAWDMRHSGCTPDDMTVLPPEAVIRDLDRTASETREALPPVGTEAVTARHFIELARTGHWALLVHATKCTRDGDIVDILRRHGAEFAERYRLLVIEDLVGQNN